jgi:predicted TIM-barrel fold metal-dependent hydrolase
VIQRAALSLLIPLILWSTAIIAQTTADPDLLAEINKIKAIDNHAHPLRYVSAGEKPDDEFDALPLDNIDPFPLPTRLSPTNHEFIEAWAKLYGYSHNDMSDKNVQELLGVKQRVMREQGEYYPSWVLDQLNIETMFANRIAMGRGLSAPRFRWVAFDDALIFPLSNEAAKKSNRDYAAFYPSEERLLLRYLAESNVKTLPITLDQYLATIVTPTLERQKREGAIAVKFEAAYLRLLDFAAPDPTLARRVYAQYVRGGQAPAVEYKVLQDFLFHYVASEAGRLRLAVHIHMIDGAGGYYRQSGSNPLLLETAFNDPTLRTTNFVVVHGGYPYTKQTTSMMSKPNVYADFSAQTFFLYPRALSDVLRNWLEFYPDKILFGTDAFSFGPAIDWGEVAWLSNVTGRQALALALTGMMNDGEITRERALQLARMVLRENAVNLYQLSKE